LWRRRTHKIPPLQLESILRKNCFGRNLEKTLIWFI
jgi:hypothetical protein